MEHTGRCENGFSVCARQVLLRVLVWPAVAVARPPADAVGGVNEDTPHFISRGRERGPAAAAPPPLSPRRQVDSEAAEVVRFLYAIATALRWTQVIKGSPHL
jgi:hypothetical protein